MVFPEVVEHGFESDVGGGVAMVVRKGNTVTGLFPIKQCLVLTGIINTLFLGIIEISFINNINSDFIA
jgi:hypothetical protein